MDKPPTLAVGYHPSAWRYAVLLIFACSSFLSAYAWICLAPISTLIQDLWDVSALELNLFSLSFMALYLPASVLSLFTMERFGLRATLVLGAALNFACTAMKAGGSYLTDPGAAYAVVLTGQVLGAIAQPLILNVPARLCAEWFKESEQDLATIVATMSNVLGQMAGSLIPGFTVNDAADLQSMLLWQNAVPCAVVLIATVLGVKDRPPQPPSASTALQWAARDEAEKAAAAAGESRTWAALSGLASDFKRMCTHVNFMLLACGFSIATGTSWALLTLQAQLVQPCGYPASVAGSSGAALLGVGIVVALALGPVMERTKAYVELQKGGMAAAVGAVAFTLAVNKPGNSGLVIGAWCVLGAILQPLLPLSLLHAADMTFPMPADNSSTFLLILANIFSFCLTLGLTPLLALDVSANCTSVVTPAAGLVLGCMLLGFVLTAPMWREYRRQAAAAAEAEVRGGTDPLSTTASGSGSGRGSHKAGSSINSLGGIDSRRSSTDEYIISMRKVKLLDGERRSSG